MGLSARAALALPAFKKAFETEYVKPSNNDDFESAAKKASCNVCHLKGKKKDVRNPYGEELAKLIEGSAKDRLAEAAKVNADAKDDETVKLNKELLAAFKKVEAIQSAAGKTYGELLQSGNLPYLP